MVAYCQLTLWRRAILLMFCLRALFSLWATRLGRFPACCPVLRMPLDPKVRTWPCQHTCMHVTPHVLLAPQGEAFPSTAGVAMDGDLAHGHDPPGLDPLGPQGTHFRRLAAYMRGRRTATLHRHFWMWRATHALEAFDRSLQRLRAQGGPEDLPV